MPSNLTIVVPNYPSNNRTPGFFVGVDPSGANTATPLQQTLLIGQIANTGTATVNTPVAAQSLTQVQTLCGQASMLAQMYKTYTGDDGFGSITLLPLADAAGSVAGVYTITFTGPATAAGSLAIYIAGQVVNVAVASGDTATVIATNTVAAMTTALLPLLPVTATSAAGVVTCTAKQKGLTAGDIDFRMNYRGALSGEITPAGVAVAFAQTTAGATDPTLTTALTNLGDTPYAFIVTPYNGSAQLGQVQALLSDVTGQWSPLTNTGGGAFTAMRATYGTLATYGITNNYQHISVLGLFDTPTPGYLMAASYGGVCANSLRIDPSLPLTAVVMVGILAPPVQSRFSRTNRNTLLYDGIATSKSNSANQVILERAVTSYQVNLLGAPDNSYLQVEVLYSIQAVINLWKGAFTSKYARMKLVDNSTNILPGTNTCNPNSIRGEVLAQYQIAINAGLCQNMAQFTAGVNVQKASTTSVNIYAPIILADQLFIIAVDLAFSQ